MSIFLHISLNPSIILFTTSFDPSPFFCSITLFKITPISHGNILLPYIFHDKSCPDYSKDLVQVFLFPILLLPSLSNLRYSSLKLLLLSFDINFVTIANHLVTSAIICFDCYHCTVFELRTGVPIVSYMY